MSRDAWLSLHILGVVLFLGNILVTAVWKTLADRTRSAPVVAYAQRLVTVTDIGFTATGVLLIIISGQVMADDFGGVFDGPTWLTIGWSLFIASGIIWLAVLIPVEVMQARLAREFRNAESIPDRYWRLFDDLGDLWGYRDDPPAREPLFHGVQARLMTSAVPFGALEERA